MKAAIVKLLKAVGHWLAHISVQRVAVICTVFALVIGGGAYTARYSDSLFGTSSPQPPPQPELASRSDNVTGSASMKDDDPVKNFHKTGIGQVLFSTSNKDTCKRTLFDNNTGGYKIVDDINCGNGPDQNFDDKKSEQLNSMRKAFNR